MSFYQVQAQNFALSGAGAVAGAISIVLKTFAQIDGTLLTMADFGDIGYITLEPGNGTLEEQASFTGVVQNANGTATLTGIKNVLDVTPFTETAGLAQTHAGSTTVVLSNTAGYYTKFAIKDNDETITGQWTFDVFPVTPSNSDASTTVKGVTKLSVAPVSATEPIATGTNDPRMPIAYAVDSVGTDSYAIAPSPAISAYVAGQVFTFKAGTANTGTATLNVNALGAKTIKKSVSTDLITGDILVGQVVMVEYDGTNLQLISPVAGTPSPIVRTYLNAGSPASWTKPTGLKYVVVEVQAAGGGGGGTTTANSHGSGGGAGGFSRKLIAAATLGSSETVTTGAGGTAGSGAGTTIGGTGGSSSFGTHSTATGGVGGTGGSAPSGGAGGVGSSGDINLAGGGGVAAGVISGTMSGAGGSSHLGGGGPGLQGGGSNVSGGVGGVYGGGGNGAYNLNGVDLDGATGAAGIVIVTEYYA